MLLNEVKRLGVLYGRTLCVMESALTKLRWSTFESWVWLNRDRIFEARFRDKAEHEEESSDVERVISPSDGDEQGEAGQEEAAAPSDDDKEMADFKRESFRWHWRRATRPPRPLPTDYRDLCPRFSLSKAERAALDFELSKMVQAIFYAMLLNDAIELGIVSGFLASDLRSSLEGLRWTSFEAWLSRTSRDLREAQLRQRNMPSEACGTEQAAEYVQDTFRWTLRESSAPGPKPLLMDYHGLCPRFDLRVAARYAHNSNILEMVQAIFYAMVVDDAAELGLSRRLTMDCMMWAMRKLDWNPVESLFGDIDRRLRKAQASQPANPLADPAPSAALLKEG
ncbi:hypothetical protein Cgig2_028072 [Carnegiea gigantea]|uniref:Uncharacterized protein n=1 Tax=Carnegiea gigantea TaxID=171969 RepID=A0A9Q1GH21_9CARY|nr:hypothetical protein Cgig2_028072 [Carnegiea gigantea]